MYRQTDITFQEEVVYVLFWDRGKRKVRKGSGNLQEFRFSDL